MSPDDRRVANRAFRRRRFAARHKRRSLWPLIAKELAVAVLIVGIPLALAAWAIDSPRLEVRHLDVSATERVPEEWIQEVLSLELGQNLMLLSLAGARQRIQQHPWVGEVVLRKRPPDTLRVRVVERRPAALLRRGEELYFVDASGDVIAPFDFDEKASDLVLISVETGDAGTSEVRRSLELAAELERLGPSWGGRLSEVVVIGPHDFRLHTTDLQFPLLVSARRLEQGLSDLARWLPRITRAYGSLDAIDLRFARQIVLQPAAPAAQSRKVRVNGKSG